MVQFPGSRSMHLWIQCTVTGLSPGRVTPFGNPRIIGCLLLPVAFRSLPRPSSPDSSEASTMNSFSLDHILSLPLLNKLPFQVTPPFGLRNVHCAGRSQASLPQPALVLCPLPRSPHPNTVSRITARHPAARLLPHGQTMHHCLPTTRPHRGA